MQTYHRTKPNIKWDRLLAKHCSRILFQAVPREVSEIMILEEIVDLNGDKHGEIYYEVIGDTMTTVSLFVCLL